MLQGLYAAASGMIAQRERLDVVANNLANIPTTGFKKADPVSRGFYQVFAEQIGRFPSPRGAADVPGGGAAIDATSEDFSPGSIVDTGNALDVAIDGSGFFVVQTPSGERYTRAGSFALDQQDQLVTPNGFPVLGLGGPIIISGDNMSISSDGTVTIDGVAAEQIRIVDFPEPALLTKYRQTLYGATDDVRRTATTVLTPDLRAGALEQSNVNPIAELVALMDASRTYESQQRVITAFDETLDSAVNQIART
jgi:flagellar basal-body rod protein FlgG